MRGPRQDHTGGRLQFCPLVPGRLWRLTRVGTLPGREREAAFQAARTVREDRRGVRTPGGLEANAGWDSGRTGSKGQAEAHGRLGGGRGAPYRLRHSHTCALRTAVAQVGGCHAVGSSDEGLRSVVARRSDDGPAKDFISDAEGWAAR